MTARQLAAAAWRVAPLHARSSAAVVSARASSSALGGAASTSGRGMPEHAGASEQSRGDPLSLLTAGQLEQASAFLDLLLETNESLNLTAVRSKDEALRRHVADCLALLPVIEASCPGTGSLRLVDVGSGGGLPGMVLAIARPAWRVTLLDSLGKRCAFLESAAAALGVANVAPLWARAEEAGRDAGHREVYDVAVARAVAEARVLAELCLPLVRVGGSWVAAKGPDPQEEINRAASAIEALGGELQQVVNVESWGPGGQPFTAAVVRKVHGTPAKYPRRPGMPNKRPL